MPPQMNSTAIIEQNQLPDFGPRFFKLIIDNVNMDTIVESILAIRCTGRPGYHPRVMMRAWLLKYIKKVKYAADFLEELRRNQGMRRVCGFDDHVPTEGAFSNFNKRLKDYPELVAACLHQTNEAIRRFLPDLGTVVAIDSTCIQTWAHERSKKDNNAKWGFKHRTKSKSGDKVEHFYGYKLHVISDATHEIPLGAILTAANVHDTTVLERLFKQVQEAYTWFKPKYLLADRGYDSEANHRFLIEEGVTPVIHIRVPTAEDKLYDGIYNKDGDPVCMGKKAMTYVQTDTETGFHQYRCPIEGCRLKTEGTKAITHCDTVVWFDPKENPRVMGPLPRASEKWTTLYSMRMSIERLFKNLKESRLMEGQRFIGEEKIRHMTTMAMLTYNVTFLAHLQIGSKNPRKVKVRWSK